MKVSYSRIKELINRSLTTRYRSLLQLTTLPRRTLSPMYLWQGGGGVGLRTQIWDEAERQNTQIKSVKRSHSFSAMVYKEQEEERGRRRTRYNSIPLSTSATGELGLALARRQSPGALMSTCCL